MGRNKHWGTARAPHGVRVGLCRVHRGALGVRGVVLTARGHSLWVAPFWWKY